MKIFFSAVVIFLLQTSLFSAIKMTPEQFSERYYVEVDSCRFKFGIDYSFAESYRLKVWKEIDGSWQLKNRFVMNSDRYEGFEVLDWDNDGFKDVRVKFICNSGYHNFLLMYDDSLKQYKNIEMYPRYCGSHEFEKAVPKSKNYHYNFIEVGCAGSSWQSFLFKIEDFKIVVLGSMDIDDCDESREIKIYKHVQNEEPLKLATIGMEYIINYYGTWKNYAVHYWKKHSEIFLE